jgi:hypothetical protein
MLILSGLAVCLLGTTAEAGRGGRRPRWNRIRDAIRRELDHGEGAPAEKPIDWMTDFAAAVDLAGKEDRPLMVLFTTEQLARTSRSCTFQDDSMRRAVHSAKPVPVKILPPVQLDLRGVPKAEADARRRLFEKSRKQYAELIKKYRINTGPCLIFAAPDRSALNTLITPPDSKIKDTLARLPDLMNAYNKAAGKDPKAAGKQPDPAAKPADPPKPVVVKDPGGKDEMADPEDDF